VLLRHQAQPVLGDLRFEPGDALDALEVLAEGLVELVVVRLVLDQAGAREVIELVDAVAGDVLLQRLEQGEEFLGRDRQLAGFRWWKKSISMPGYACG
jgi:hypothetical protein